MFGNFFYNEGMRKVIIAFGQLFNNIVIQSTSSTGAVTKRLKVPLAYAPKEFDDLNYICGLDEVGRGCGAGPVVTAAVIMPKDFKSPLIRDSKKLTEKNSEKCTLLLNQNFKIYINENSQTRTFAIHIYSHYCFKCYIAATGKLV